jgi:hypothetical protein
MPITIERIRIATSDTGAVTAGAAFRIWLFAADPTTSSGVTGGDGAAFSVKQGSFIGSMSGSLISGLNNGSVAICLSEAGSRIITNPVSAGVSIYALLQTLTVFTPLSASTFTLTLEGLQGRA